MVITKAIANSFEKTFMQSHLSFTQSFLQQTNQGAFKSIAGGSACFSGPDSFFSQVIGWGFDTTEQTMKDEIEQIEDFYRKCGFYECHIELSTMVSAKVANMLSELGYQVVEFSDISYLDLSMSSCFSEPLLSEQVTIPTSCEIEQWASVVSKGFSVSEQSDLFATYVKSPNIIPFVAYESGHMAAGGTMAIFNNICDLGMTSTLAEFRGRGLQKKLLKARLHYAKQQQAKIAIVATEPGSISNLNIQKIGFQCAYARIKFQKTEL